MTYLFLLQILLLVAMIVLMKMSWLEPIPLYVLPWAVVAVGLALPILEFVDGVFSFESLAVLSVSIWLFVAGALLRRGMVAPDNPAPKDATVAYNALISVVLNVAALAYLGAALLEIQQRGISNSLLALDFQGIRELHWDEFYAGDKSVAAYVLSVTRPFAVLSVLSLPLHWQAGGRRQPFLSAGVIIGVLAWGGLLIETAAVGGRSLITYTTIGAIYGAVFAYTNGVLIPSPGVLLRPRVLLRIVGFTLLGLAAGYVLFVWFPSLRSRFLSSFGTVEFNSYLMASVGARLGPLGDVLVDVLGQDIAFYLIRFGGYVIIPTPMLTTFFEFSDFTNWYYLGSFNFPALYRIVDILYDLGNTQLPVRERIAAVLLSAGRTSLNPWATGIRDLLLDFGVAGSMVLVFVFGVLAQHLYMRTVRFPTFENRLLQSLVALLTVLFVFFNGTRQSFMLLPMLLILGMMVVARLRSRTASRYGRLVGGQSLPPSSPGVADDSGPERNYGD